MKFGTLKKALFFLVLTGTLFWSSNTLSQQHFTNIIVAMIDTGIDPNHPEIEPYVWKPLKDSSFFGWDFSHQNSEPFDDHGHGTHIAGIILQQLKYLGENKSHIVLLPIKYYSKENSGRENLNNTVQAIYYAVKQGARIINYSAGGSEYSSEEFEAIRYAEKKGVLFVSAVGNEGKNLDIIGNDFYPSKYGLSNIISVAAIDESDHLLASSSYGHTHVDIAAPGHDILSTLPRGKYGKMSGTSQATAYVTGVAASLLVKNPSLKPAEIKQIIKQTSIKIDELEEKISCGGKIYLPNALAWLEKAYPGKGPQKNLKLLNNNSLARNLLRNPVKVEKNRILSQLSRIIQN